MPLSRHSLVRTALAIILAGAAAFGIATLTAGGGASAARLHTSELGLPVPASIGRVLPVLRKAPVESDAAIVRRDPGAVVARRSALATIYAWTEARAKGHRGRHADSATGETEVCMGWEAVQGGGGGSGCGEAATLARNGIVDYGEVASGPGLNAPMISIVYGLVPVGVKSVEVVRGLTTETVAVVNNVFDVNGTAGGKVTNVKYTLPSGRVEEDSAPAE